MFLVKYMYCTSYKCDYPYLHHFYTAVMCLLAPDNQTVLVQFLSPPVVAVRQLPEVLEVGVLRQTDLPQFEERRGIAITTSSSHQDTLY